VRRAELPSVGVISIGDGITVTERDYRWQR
jgi:hypothetical protein